MALSKISPEFRKQVSGILNVVYAPTRRYFCAGFKVRPIKSLPVDGVNYNSTDGTVPTLVCSHGPCSLGQEVLYFVLKLIATGKIPVEKFCDLFPTVNKSDGEVEFDFNSCSGVKHFACEDQDDFIVSELVKIEKAFSLAAEKKNAVVSEGSHGEQVEKSAADCTERTTVMKKKPEIPKFITCNHEDEECTPEDKYFNALLLLLNEDLPSEYRGFISAIMENGWLAGMINHPHSHYSFWTTPSSWPCKKDSDILWHPSSLVVTWKIRQQIEKVARVNLFEDPTNAKRKIDFCTPPTTYAAAVFGGYTPKSPEAPASSILIASPGSGSLHLDKRGRMSCSPPGRHSTSSIDRLRTPPIPRATAGRTPTPHPKKTLQLDSSSWPRKDLYVTYDENDKNFAVITRKSNNSERFRFNIIENSCALIYFAAKNYVEGGYNEEFLHNTWTGIKDKIKRRGDTVDSGNGNQFDPKKCQVATRFLNDMKDFGEVFCKNGKNTPFTFLVEWEATRIIKFVGDKYVNSGAPATLLCEIWGKVLDLIVGGDESGDFGE